MVRDLAGNLRVAAAAAAGRMMVVIAADPDLPGHRAAVDAARRWRGEGRTVRIATPDAAGTDFNDLLRAKLAARKASHG